uniref:Uncharacterized protein n=1 Tax=Rhizophora mucronata TaxID=61149 RepID=A0A2P2MTB9_RHIMU
MQFGFSFIKKTTAAASLSSHMKIQKKKIFFLGSNFISGLVRRHKSNYLRPFEGPIFLFFYFGFF